MLPIPLLLIVCLPPVLSPATLGAGEPEWAHPQFSPLVSIDQEFDWVRLTSGEWLKGEILRLRDGSFEFDSDELDELTLDWDDIAEVHSQRQHTILLVGRRERQGTLLVKGGDVFLDGEDGERFGRSEVMAFIPGAPSEWNYWSGKASLGLSLRKGNTSQTDLTAYFFARRETAATRWDTTYNGAVSETLGVETANNHRLNGRFDVFLTHRLYVTPFNGTASRDPFSNIDLRFTPGAGFGYDLVDANTLSWEVEAGPAYQYTRYESVEPGLPRSEDSMAVSAGTNLEWDVTPDVEVKFGYNITAPLPDSDEYNHHLSTILSLDLIDSIDLDVTFIWDRVNKPLADVEGDLPSKDDLRLSVGLGFDF
jgi:putative salt-induced outer membrane protein YdiY